MVRSAILRMTAIETASSVVPHLIKIILNI